MMGFIHFVCYYYGLQGKGQMNTYWLAGKQNDPGIDKICNDLRQQTNKMLCKEDQSIKARYQQLLHVFLICVS